MKDSSSSPTNLVNPIDLLASSNANGTNELSWSRNSNPQGTVFIIESLEKPSIHWILVGTTTKSTFDHTSQTPGKTQYYRILAKRTDVTSQPSNEAVVYPE